MADLTTLAALKQYMGLSTTDKDALLQSLITSTSAAIESFLDREVLSRAYTQRVDGNGGYRMMFPCFPVTAVASVAVDGVVIPLAANYQTAGYRFDDTQLILQGYRFTRGMRNVELTYTAGYAVVPADLENACIKLCAGKFKERDWLGIKSKGLAGETITYSDIANEPSIRDQLYQYKKVALC